MTDAFRWDQLPELSPERDWATIAGRLRSRPGEWAVVVLCKTGNNAAVTARHIRLGKYRDLPVGEYEATSRTVGSEYRVYARYVGGFRR